MPRGYYYLNSLSQYKKFTQQLLCFSVNFIFPFKWKELDEFENETYSDYFFLLLIILNINLVEMGRRDCMSIDLLFRHFHVPIDNELTVTEYMRFADDVNRLSIMAVMRVLFRFSSAPI
jgi:hypothetical protein